MPFEDASYEIVTAVFCWHWFNKVKVAEEVHRVLQNNGRLAIINYEWIPFKNDITMYTQELIETFNPTSKRASETLMFPEWADDIYNAGFSQVETFSFDVKVNYCIENWIGRIQTSPEIGGALRENDIVLFNQKLENFLSKQTDGPFEIPYRVFGVIGKS
ncbi:hypothetical protein GCM10011346_21570 [Oceanobacillus neutriphilus]|uniref:Methyltransferase type 11 domain-containing protein n=2 Tax=Oceanobacillus neutriphilus TaxID=531815 RepID=A0ABQ2NUS8_9BACI|nr:hypothetical protein GCM10011346_21570 [Oceanobacillus neutriphilus]